MKLLERLFPLKKINVHNNIFQRRFALLDIGARGGLQWPWNCFNKDQLSVVLVEPDPIEAEKLRLAFKSTEITVLPQALWREESSLTLNLNKSPGTSSIFFPNKQLLDQFPDADRYDAIKTHTIKAVSIDNLVGKGVINQIDFIKLDVQGAELAILEGGCKHLSSNLVGLEVEVEFAEIYHEQPLFADVEAFVRKQLGLELWDLRKTYWKYKAGKDISAPIKGRLAFGDALFFRPLSGLAAWLETHKPDMAREKAIMLMISILSYGYVDYAITVLSAPVLTKYFDSTCRRELHRVIKTIGTGFRPFRHGNSRLFFILDAFAKALQPTHEGWASIGRNLGSRRLGPFWY